MTAAPTYLHAVHVLLQKVHQLPQRVRRPEGGMVCLYGRALSAMVTSSRFLGSTWSVSECCPSACPPPSGWPPCLGCGCPPPPQPPAPGQQVGPKFEFIQLTISTPFLPSAGLLLPSCSSFCVSIICCTSAPCCSPPSTAATCKGVTLFSQMAF